MEPRVEALSLYGNASEQPALEWSWAQSQLESARTYWVVARGTGHPHPRPVWGVWNEQGLFLSIGSPTIRRQLGDDPTVTVHLESGTDVVIVEGRASGSCVDPSVIDLYDVKYDWTYDVGEYGPLTSVLPSTVMAWRSADWAGRGGFQTTGRWRLPVARPT